MINTIWLHISFTMLNFLKENKGLFCCCRVVVGRVLLGVVTSSDYQGCVWQYISFRFCSSPIKSLFCCSKIWTRFSRHFIYSFFFRRHSRAASLFFNSRTSRLRAASWTRATGPFSPPPTRLCVSCNDDSSDSVEVVGRYDCCDGRPTSWSAELVSCARLIKSLVCILW